ncbi:MAG: hypothetical protein F6K61_15565 [Sphaerospermopsis sp. SIO1G1]|nr:hypothetical protein [Sphaerospermopsis sp. SIO1G1]
MNHLVSGLAINLLMSGIISFLARLIFSDQSRQRLLQIRQIMIPGFSDIPLIANLLFEQDILFYLLFVLIALITYIGFLFYF